MAGYWPSSFFACLWIETESRSISSQGNNEANIKPSWLIKNLLHGFRGNFSCWTRRVVPSEQEISILNSRVANLSAEFGSSHPLTELVT